MYMTRIIGFQARTILSNVLDSIFTETIKHEIFLFKQSFDSKSVYQDLQNTVGGQVDKLVDRLCYLEEPINATKLDSIHQLLSKQPVAVQTALFERFAYAAERFAEVGRESVPEMHTEIQTLYRGLIYFWGMKGEKKQ